MVNIYKKSRQCNMDWMRYDLYVDTLRALEEALEVFYYPG
jgi:hypothetical protein